jgi:hypothetical protein
MEEAQRTREAAQDVAPEVPLTKRALTQHILACFRDGEYHCVRDMALAVGAESGFVRAICDRIVRRGSFETFGERRLASPAQGSYAYRFVKGGKRIDMTVLLAELQPILDDMERLVHGHRVDFSQQAMALALAQIRQVLARVAR